MAEIDGITRVHGLTRAVLGHDDPPLTSCPLAASRKALRDALVSHGFIDLTGGLIENFKAYLDRELSKIEVGELTPGMLEDLTSWVASEVASDASRAQQVQAHIDPERAVRLLV